ncbi:MAG: exo-alpha-sialidase [Myxococcaceae bacterium]|nr:exo-alpha-sialidase [Myxococcaceae bacterium]
MRTLLTAATLLVFAGCDGIVGDMPADEPTAGGNGDGVGGGGQSPTAGGGEVSTAGGGAASTAGGSTAGGSTAGGGATAGGSTAGGMAATAGGGASANQVPVFVAVGKQWRRAISCDDGRTWVNDNSVDDAWPVAERYRCFAPFTLPDGGAANTDCDHNHSTTPALGYANGVFLQQTGWGAPGRIFRSTNGVDWAQVDMGANATDVMFDDNRFIIATRSSRRSDDLGATWQMNGTIDVANGTNTIWNVRGGIAGGGVYLVTAQDGANLDYAYSSDRGATWRRPTMVGGGRVDVCGAGHPAYGNGIFVSVTWNQAMNASIICRSADGAATWSSTTLMGEYMESRPLWTGTEFMVWSNGRVHRSADGITWSSMNTQTRRNGMTSGGPNIGAVARNANGTFVATRGGWQVWYDQQRFYRSTDGVVWDELATGTYEQGHPITAIAAGFATRSAVCP